MLCEHSTQLLISNLPSNLTARTLRTLISGVLRRKMTDPNQADPVLAVFLNQEGTVRRKREVDLELSSLTLRPPHICLVSLFDNL